MRALIPYAGFDPRENEFFDRKLELRFGKRGALDGEKCKKLKDEGFKLKQIGKIMAKKDGRRSPYKYEAVYNAITRYNKQVENAK